jgi:F-type H+-transporting ATPase subunit a
MTIPLISSLLGLPALLMAAEGGPDQHVYNHPFSKTPEGLWLWSGNVGNLVLSAIILIVGGLWVASKVKTGPESQGHRRWITTNRWAHLVEVLCVYLQDEVVQPMLGERTKKLMPFLWTVFFFVLINNMLGLIPLLDVQHLISKSMREQETAFVGGTATQNLWVTGCLALIAGIVFNIAAVFRLGIGGFLKHMTGGAPFPISILLFVIELIGQIVIKPVALAIRLFANMTAGHILLAVLYSFVAVAIASIHKLTYAGAAGISLVSIGGAIFITFLELFVAVLQAFVFMFLTAVFISLMDHSEEHGHEHGHDHAPGHEHAHA